MAYPVQPIPTARAFGIAAAFIVGYVALALLSRHYLVRPFAITAWYPAAGLALGLLLVYGLRFWPALAIAATCNLLLSSGIPASPYTQFFAPLIITAGYASMAALLRGPLGFRNEFDRVRDVWLLVAVSAVGTLLMGLIYVSALRFDSAMTMLEFGRAVTRFWIGHLVGIVINTPLLLLLLIDRQRVSHALRRRSRLEIAAQMAAAMLALLVIFGPQWTDEYKWFYVLFMPLIWIATRSGIVGAVLGIAIIQLGLIVAILNSTFQHGTAVTEFQFMMLALAVTGLFLGMFVTERGEAHDALNRSARLAAAGEMAAALAHELHQPLSAIRNYASAFRLVDSAQAAPALMHKVECEAVRAAEIVQRLRDFFQAGTSRLERIDVGELIAIALAHSREEAAKKGVSLDMAVAQKADLLIDRVQIETVLHCLIGNAIDALATAEGARQVRVEAAGCDEGWINVSVIDSGPGISPVMQGRLFEPFATNKPSGIGLGLSVSRSLVEAHGGRLWAESVPAGGAVFHFSLPTAELKQGEHA
jgi:signal transduction histidine kinase